MPVAMQMEWPSVTPDQYGRIMEILLDDLEGRLMPAVQEVGLTSQPKVDVYPAHNLYAPGRERVAELGASAVPAA